uniref:Uncharacterized protein n=1 Tax=Chenopodium quinoa TaxID=63459 RepID=A0A803NAU3_CHEQI
MFQGWCMTTNFAQVEGERILVAWLSDIFQLPLNLDDRMGRQISFNEIKPLRKFTQECSVSDLVQTGYIEAQFLTLKKKLNEVQIKQAKIKWLQIGDENSAYFHRSLKLRKFNKSVITIQDCEGVWCDTPDKISDAFVNYYKSLLGADLGEGVFVQQEIIRQGAILSDEQAQKLCAPFSREDVKKAMFSILVDKAP